MQGLDAGADDYLTKPFEQSEFLARVRTLIRRAAGGALSLTQIGEITLDTLARTVSKLELARRIQIRLTPDKPLRLDGVDLAFHYQPAQWVGGDYCDFWTLRDGRLVFVVADVAGKGMPAAIIMANLHASLHASTAFCATPAEAVAYVNQHLRQHSPDDLFATLFLGILDCATGRLEYVNAGHMPPLLSAAGSPVDALTDSANGVLGISAEPFSAGTQMLKPGACLLAVTDGITEAESPDGEQFGMGRVQRLLGEAHGSTAQQLVSAVAGAATAFRGSGPQQDDVTVLGLRWTGKTA